MPRARLTTARSEHYDNRKQIESYQNQHEFCGRSEFLHPVPAKYPRARGLGYNNTSIVLRVLGLGSSALLTGDLEASGWELIAKKGNQVKADVLKFPHHGAWKNRDGTPADPTSFLESVGARTVVFSVGSYQKGYNHPDSHVFEAVRLSGATILCTQATKRCGLKTPDQHASDTKPQLEKALIDAGIATTVLCQKGTSCAGSIIIDLAETPIIRSPEPEFHRKSIVQKFFAEQNKCCRH